MTRTAHASLLMLTAVVLAAVVHTYAPPRPWWSWALLLVALVLAGIGAVMLVRDERDGDA